MNVSDIENDSLEYMRSKDKSDKSGEIYKFYINALYVALTRAMLNVYLLETKTKEPVLELLGLAATTTSLSMQNKESTADEWQKEARKLELQGKKEQAERIRKQKF